MPQHRNGGDPAEGRKWTIHPSDRIYWDIFVLMVIVASAFEIPYDWLVGWKESRIPLFFDLLFFLVFMTDMILNSLTMRDRSFTGFWGSRNLLGFFKQEWSSKYHHDMALEENPQMAMVLDDNPAIVKSYMRSGWFLIDLLSTIPWGLLAETFSPLTSLRLLRLLRLSRMFRVLRLTKAIYLLERIRRAIPAVPSVERLLFIAMSIPWIAHMLACLVYYVEHTYGTGRVTYATSFYAMWMAILARQTLLDGPAWPSFLLAMLGVIISVFVIAALTGNLAALYTSLDFGKERNRHVVLENHSIVVGWNNNVFSVIHQLLMSEEEDLPGDIVLLSNKTSAQVWQEFDEFGLSFDPRRLTIHTGSIHSVHNIRKLSVGRARNVVLLGSLAHEEGLSEAEVFRRADTEVLKILLACCNAFNIDEWARVSRRGRGKLSIVAAVHSRKMARMLGCGIPRKSIEDGYLDIHIVDVEDTLSRCIAQVTAEPMLAELFRELFSYTHSGDHSNHRSHEIYILELDELLDARANAIDLGALERKVGAGGLTFDSLRVAFPTAIPIGFYARPEIIPEALVASYEQQLEDKRSDLTRMLFLNPGIDLTRAGRFGM